MVIGLTGGMGCGKSTAAQMFVELGWGLVDSDALVRQLLRDDAAAVAEVRREFGADVFAASGAVDRRKLAAKVFADAAALRRLEAILHPRVRSLRLQRVAQRPPEHWVAEVALLFETALEKEFDFTVCVASDAAVQAQRLASRGLAPQEVSQRIARQLPLAQKIERADFVLTNNGSLAFLHDQVIRLARLLTRSAA